MEFWVNKGFAQTSGFFNKTSRQVLRQVFQAFFYKKNLELMQIKRRQFYAK